MDSLPFHPAVSRWFSEHVGSPTDVQRKAWPLIARGDNVLVTAPTGTGKTLAAFLVALDRLLSGAWTTGGLRVLYVSPLKALNNDIQKNLSGPLAALNAEFVTAGLCPPDIRVLVRSGDTPENERRVLRKHPPEILITTPESLGILLTQAPSINLFAGLKAVIVDEVHAVIGSKRGTALLLGLERLAELAGDFQRIGLSATVEPPALVAQALAGFNEVGEARRVAIVTGNTAKTYDVRVVLPRLRPEPSDSAKIFWESLALDLRQEPGDRASTLIFTNSRRACEKLARLMNESPDGSPAPELTTYSHHGSLSKEIRQDVESRLKAGTLRALVATNSLELGIDIGDLDEVILAQTPKTAASAIQKVGRAGHRTGQVSRARLYPSHGLDLVEAAVLVPCILGQQVEPVVIPEGPLDVLAQTLLSCLCARPATTDQLFALVCRAWPYRHLMRAAFDLVIEMLAGRYAGTRIAELRPRISCDPETGCWSARDNVPFLLYSSGGTIPDRGYFALKDSRSGAALGELDEEFVWERNLGDRFAMGAQVWKIDGINDQSVLVTPVDAPPHIVPFWKAEEQDRAWFLAEKIGLFLEKADRALGGDSGSWEEGLKSHHGLSPEAAASLVETLTRERNLLGALPHRWRLVIEHVQTPATRNVTPEAQQFIFHTLWGGRMNRPWAFALAQAWEDRFGYTLETYPGDNQVLVLVPPETEGAEILSLVTATNLEDLLRRRLETTGYFGARFREGAGRALLLPRAGFSKRMPLWQTRLKAKRLHAAVAAFADFPILVEAWRQCLRDEFDLANLRLVLDEVQTGRIAVWQVQTQQPSAFAEGLLWRQVNEHMYGDDTASHLGARPDRSLWDELAGDDKPRLRRADIVDWESRWGRTAPGYAPETPVDLADLLEVRIALSLDEWTTLLAACVRDHGGAPQDWETAVAPVLTDRVSVRSIADQRNQPETIWLRWLEGRGPVPIQTMAAFWGQSNSEVEAWVGAEARLGTVVLGLLTEDAPSVEVCLTSTWDQLVRRGRREARTHLTMRDSEGLALFRAQWQGLVHPENGANQVQQRIATLLGLPVAADLWERVILPSRIAPYRSADFDRLFIEEGLRWFGVGSERVVLAFPEDRFAFQARENALSPEVPTVDTVFGPSVHEASFAELTTTSGLSTAALTGALWSLAWAGLASATTFAPLRQGLRTGFRYETTSETGRSTRAGFQRWANARSSGGTWHRWDADKPPHATATGPADLMEELKRRARLVLERHGVVFRGVLTTEAPGFQWRDLFPAFRLMELSGEIVGGLIWSRLPGIQFATHAALRSLDSPETDALWVQHAQDPSSLCGLGLEGWGHLPRRVAGTWLWWRGQSMAAVVSAQGKKLETGTELTPEQWHWFVRRMATLLITDGRTNWTLEAIDGTPAQEHPFALSLRGAGFQPHGDKLIFWKQ